MCKGDKTCMVYRIFLPLRFKAQKPINPAYPVKLVTIGDHLRKIRLDRRLKQTEVANILDTDIRNVFRWETTGRTPTPFLMKRILRFLGYVPIDFNTSSIGEKLFWARQIAGLSQEQTANEIRVSGQTILLIERDSKSPKHHQAKQKILDFIATNILYASNLNSGINKTEEMNKY